MMHVHLVWPAWDQKTSYAVSANQNMIYAAGHTMEIFVQEIFTTKTFAQDYHSNDYGILILLTPVFVLLHLCAHQAIDPV